MLTSYRLPIVWFKGHVPLCGEEHGASARIGPLRQAAIADKLTVGFIAQRRDGFQTHVTKN